MYAYSAFDYTTSPATVVGASKTNMVVSKLFRISEGGSRHMVIKLTAGTVTVTNAITAKLQTTTDTAGTWVDSKTVTISGNGDFYIKLMAETAGDQTYLPLLCNGRIVVTSGVGDAATITLVEVLQPT